MHDDVGIPPDGTGEVRVVGQAQPEVPEAIASQVCTRIAQERRQNKTKFFLNARKFQCYNRRLQRGTKKIEDYTYYMYS